MSLKDQIYIIPLEKNKVQDLCYSGNTNVNEIKKKSCKLPPNYLKKNDVPNNYTPFEPKMLSQGTGSFRDQFKK